MNILFAASTGGHLEQILRLEKLAKGNRTSLITERTLFPLSSWQDSVYEVPQVNRRDPLAAFKLVWIAAMSFRALLREKPDVVISTGALATVPVCLLAKLAGSRLVFIESFARVDTLSRTGHLMYRFADVFVIQWEELTKRYPKAVYGGMIY